MQTSIMKTPQAKKLNHRAAFVEKVIPRHYSDKARTKQLNQARQQRHAAKWLALANEVK